MIVIPGRPPLAAPPSRRGVRAALRLLWAALGLWALVPAVRAAGPAQTSPIVVDAAAVFHTFGGQMIFTLAAHGPAAITHAALLMRGGGDSRTQVIDARFDPATQVRIQVTVDLQAQPLAPFAPVVYEWQLADAAGNSLVTAEQTHLYDDNRFEWQAAGRGPIHVHWRTGSLSFGQAIADIGYEALNRASRMMDAALPAQLDIYVYDQLSDLQSALRLGGRAWVGGHADPRLGVVMVYGSDDPVDKIRLENDLSHELTHVMVYQLVGPGYDRMPVWLDEGLAVSAEPNPSPNYAAALDGAARQDGLIALGALCAPFDIDPGRAILSYAESASVVRYLQDRSGPAAIQQLLAAYRDGATCEGGLRKTLQISLPELQAEWESNVLQASPLSKLWSALLPYLLVFGPVLLVLTALLFIPRRK